MASTKERSAATSAAGEEAEIRRLFEHWAEAVRARDVEEILRNYAPDILSFDVVDPLQYGGRDAVRERLEGWLCLLEGPVGYESRELAVTASGDTAFAHSLNHVNGTLADGRKLEMWWRSTLCLRKRDGEWMVVHSHSSVPMNPATGKASVDLRP